ncbi:MAG: hypothetical protein LBD14_06280 [Puniceicoccales bacterium]|jgi:hypothetical protein|nr:hypothetical protein [Puniceicoccales bacterium]
MTDRKLLEQRYYLWQECEKRFKRSSALSYYAVSAFGFPLADLDGTVESINEERTDESGGYLIYPLEIISEGRAKILERIDGNKRPRFHITVLEIEKNYFLCDIDAQVDGSMGSYSVYVILKRGMKKCYDSYSGRWKDMPVIEKVARIEEPEYKKIVELVRQYKKLVTF